MNIKDFDEALMKSMFGENVSRGTFITIGKSNRNDKSNNLHK